jgi:hypothetical protein
MLGRPSWAKMFNTFKGRFQKGGISYGNEEEGYEESCQEEKALTQTARLRPR